MAFIFSFIPVVIILVWIVRNKKAPLPCDRRFWLVMFWGVLAIIPVTVIGLGLEPVLSGVEAEFPVLYILLDNILLVGIVEEGFKLLALYLGLGRLKKLQNPAQLIPYGMVAAAGFALMENVFYLMDDSSLFLGVIRGVFSAPGHMAYTLIVIFLFLQYRKTGRKFWIFFGIVLSGAIHGCNNFCLHWTTESEISFAYVYLLLVLPAIIALTYVIIVSALRRYKKSVARHRAVLLVPVS
jgi:RsiW-degrading membrane proteinase PrsW (M82 family)